MSLTGQTSGLETKSISVLSGSLPAEPATKYEILNEIEYSTLSALKSKTQNPTANFLT